VYDEKLTLQERPRAPFPSHLSAPFPSHLASCRSTCCHTIVSELPHRLAGAAALSSGGCRLNVRGDRCRSSTASATTSPTSSASSACPCAPPTPRPPPPPPDRRVHARLPGPERRVPPPSTRPTHGGPPPRVEPLMTQVVPGELGPRVGDAHGGGFQVLRVRRALVVHRRVRHQRGAILRPGRRAGVWHVRRGGRGNQGRHRGELPRALRAGRRAAVRARQGRQHAHSARLLCPPV